MTYKAAYLQMVILTSVQNLHLNNIVCDLLARVAVGNVIWMQTRMDQKSHLYSRRAVLMPMGRVTFRGTCTDTPWTMNASVFAPAGRNH